MLVCLQNVREGRAGHPDILFAQREGRPMEETRALSLEMRYRLGGVRSELVASRALASARKKIEGLARQRRESAETEEQEEQTRIRETRRQRKDATRRGKRVTLLPQDVTREKEDEMDEPTPACRECGEKVGAQHTRDCSEDPLTGQQSVVRLSECGEKEEEPVAAFVAGEEGFADRVAREAEEEAEKVIRDLQRVRFRADQVLRVLRALGLPTPDLLEEISSAALDEALRAEREEPAEEPPPPPSEPPTPPPAEDPVPAPPAAEEPGAPPPKRTGGAKTSLPEVEEGAKRLGIFTVKRLGEELGVAGPTLNGYLKQLYADDKIGRGGGERGPGVFYYHADYDGAKTVKHAKGTEEAAPTPEPEATPDRPDPAAWPTENAVRDHVVGKEGQFTQHQVTREMGAESASGHVIILDRLQALARRGVIEAVLDTDDMHLFEYVPPSGPGRAAEIDAARRREEAAASNGIGGAPVPGTGAGVRAGNKEVQALLDAARAAGGNVSKTGSDHYAIENPQNGRRVIIFGTPGAPSRDKNKKKLAGIGLPV